ncbi:MAG: GNAT family N-acetyltransferase [Akkermansiaceae bacterium]|nr:GNAT family N-acetyltransferase [Akkermansiaceae bacterium]NNM28272.1 GNAT family N-acetyltransferase [Akkermansiaceae bacterium]
MPIPPETIETERLVLRPHRCEDVDDILAFAAEEKWSRHMPVPYPYDRRDAEEFIARGILADPSECRSYCLEIDGHAVGGMELRFVPKYRLAELGYALAPQFWSKGYVTEAARALIAAAFTADPGLNRIRAWTTPENSASHRVLKKLGFRQEGVLRQERIIRGELVDSVFFGLLRDEWNID